MVCLKDDGSFSHFDWEKHYNWLIDKDNHDGDLENIVQSKLEVMKRYKDSKNAKRYELLSNLLRTEIAVASDEKDFGYENSDEIVRDFVHKKQLAYLFDDTDLFDDIYDDENFEILDITEEDELIAAYGRANLEFVKKQKWICDDLDHYLG